MHSCQFLAIKRDITRSLMPGSTLNLVVVVVMAAVHA
jgi:hypothetical protein